LSGSVAADGRFQEGPLFRRTWRVTCRREKGELLHSGVRRGFVAIRQLKENAVAAIEDAMRLAPLAAKKYFTIVRIGRG